MTLFVLGMLPLILKRPYIGILVWSWLSYMNPHRYTWGFAYSFPFAQIVAIVTIVAIVLAGKKLRLGSGPFFPVWACFLIWMGITTINAMFPDAATVQYIKILKIQFVILLTVLLIDDKEKLIQMLWVIALSVGYFGIKGGVFTIQTAGAYRVWGPPDSFIRDNNELGLALLMVVPLFYFFYGFYKNPKVKFGLVVCMLLIALSVIGTQSRGCMLAGGCVVTYLWWHSQNKIPAMIALVVVVFGLLAFAPDTWFERMNTISEYQEDNSAMGRINAWWYALNVANDNITGAGLDSYSPQTFAIYAPDPERVHAAHSIYFGVLADHGWVGLSFFLLLMWISWRNASWLIQRTADIDQLAWVNSLSRMIKVSLIAYLSGGVFYSLAYFDLPWHLMAVLLILRKIVEPQLSVERKSESTNSRAALTRGPRTTVKVRPSS